MPNLDGTGPKGKGPKTGRKQGQCADDNDTANPRPRLGRRSRNSGRGADIGQRQK